MSQTARNDFRNAAANVGAKFQRARSVRQVAGVRGLASHAVGFARHHLRKPTVKRLPRGFIDVVSVEDILAANPTVPRIWSPPTHAAPFTLHWVIPPAGPGSGGHHNIFRFVTAMHHAGFTNRVSIYDPGHTGTLSKHRSMITRHYEPLPCDVELWAAGTEPGDAIIATGWQTAYPVFNHSSDVQRFYFVQDFEPHFYPAGSFSALAESTYRFGFHGITAGRWLKDILTRDFSMTCDAFELGVDTNRYFLTNPAKRTKVLFYARPSTPRRAWELGILSLLVFHGEHPDIEIHTAGSTFNNDELGITTIDHGVLALDELNDLYNEMAASLVISMTNGSLLPLELIAAGCIPVINDAPNTRMLLSNPHAIWSRATPTDFARALSKAILLSSEHKHHAVAESAAGHSWFDSERAVAAAIRARLGG